jgi:hypothetical protein
VLDKIKPNHIYPEITNYWTPLEITNEEDDEEIKTQLERSRIFKNKNKETNG